MTVFMKNLRRKKYYRNAVLVLPPFSNLYHWRSRDLQQTDLSWNNFFDLESLRNFTKVLDIWEFFDKMKADKIQVSHVFKLKYFDKMMEDGVFVDKFEEETCKNQITLEGSVFGYSNVTVKNLHCMNFQGTASMLRKMFKSFKPENRKEPWIIGILNAETVLHDSWGSPEFWEARRSMRFNKNLIEISGNFMKDFLKSDVIERPKNWMDERLSRESKGGEYLCAHLRRADFLYGREKTTPTLLSAAKQIKMKLKELNLEKVFISSDCSRNEFKDLKSHLSPRFKVLRFTPESTKEKIAIKDGGIAIVDQIICSQSRLVNL